MRFLIAICGGVALCAIAALAGAQEWKPARNVDIVVASGAGGVSDRSARVVQKLLQVNPVFPSVSVTNRPGGGGSVAFNFLAQHSGDAHYIATFSPTMLTNHILGVSKLNYPEFTPLSILVREHVMLTVKADSSIASGQALVERLRKDPGSVTFAFASAAGNQNHVVIGMLFKSAGADPRKARVVIQKSGGDGMISVLGGHVDVLVGAPASAVPHIQSGKARGIGIAAPQRQAGVQATLPTLKEQGIDAVFFSWRGFIGPKGLTPAQVAFWDQAFAKLVEGDEWKKDVKQNAWTEDYMTAAETLKHLDSEYVLLKGLLGDLGVIPEKR
jgi:putative tricarboxylic transport membrane protein